MDRVEVLGALEKSAAATPFSPETQADYDSGWVLDSNSSSHRTEFKHGLGYVPRRTSILFSPEPGGLRVWPLTWSWNSGNSGNPVSISMTDKYVFLEIWYRAPLHGVWEADAGWTSYTSGYWRVFLWQ